MLRVQIHEKWVKVPSIQEAQARSAQLDHVFYTCSMFLILISSGPTGTGNHQRSSALLFTTPRLIDVVITSALGRPPSLYFYPILEATKSDH